MDKMKFETLDGNTANIEKIAELFPAAVSEGRVNFEILRTLLGDEIYDDEAYEFTWVGKREAMREAGRPIRKTLRPCPEESKEWDTTENLYIEGDNLDVLKLLQESYLGKVKMIYIDPPYNTGHDFIYHDNFRADNDEYDAQIELFDESGKKQFRENTASNPRLHSDWCSMIYPRLVLARNLLRDDGVIFISIDDNEVAQLRKICDEVFGESGFIADFIWRKKGTSTNVQNALVSALTDHIICYAKGNVPSLNRRRTSIDDRSYPFTDSEGSYRTTIIEKKDSGSYARATMKFPILGQTPREGKRWQIGEKTAREHEARGRFLVDAGIVKLKIYDFEDSDTFSANPNLLLDHGSTDSANKAVNQGLFRAAELFSNPKPVELLRHLLILGINPGEIVLDFFSGSATTAHAVMQLNVEDGGNRKFIMVQLPEATDEKSEAYKAGYKNICEIGKERIRRAGDKIKEEAGLLADDLDIGFRVLKLDESNMKDVYYAAGDYDQSLLDMMTSNIKEDRTDMDLLYGCLLEWGLPLSLPHTHEEINGVTVHTYNDGDLIACFADTVSDEVVKEIAKRQPLRVVFRDSSFANSPDKINVEEIFKLLAPKTTVKVL